MGDDEDKGGPDKNLDERVLKIVPGISQDNILSFQTKKERKFPDFYEKKKDCEDSLKRERMSERDEYTLKVDEACGLLTGYIAFRTADKEALEGVLKELHDLKCKGNSKYKIGQAYLSILKEEPEEDREDKIKKIKRFTGKDETGLLAHLVLLYDAEEKKVWSRVKNALHDQKSNPLIRRECKRLAQGDEYLEELMKKYS